MISGLILHNLKKDKGQYISFGIIILLTAFILNSALVLLFQVDKSYDKKLSDLDTADINICIPETQDTDILKKDCLGVDGIDDLESRETLLISATIKDFRGTDFSISVMFYNLDTERERNKYEIMEKSDRSLDNPIYIPLYVSQFGEFHLGEPIVFQMNGKDYTFHVAGILEEMQYGNAGSGAFGMYMPDETCKMISEDMKQSRAVEYSFVTEQGVVIEDVKNEVNTMLSEKNVNVLSILDSEKCKQTRTMVCNLLILILVTFSSVVLLVSMFLCKFRIQNSIEEEMTNMGVQKAMGYTGNMIICATIFPYMIVGIATAILGVFSSYAFLPVLAGVLALQSGFSFLLHFDIAALVLTILILAGITLVFTYLSSRRIRGLQPINAIRGNSESSHGKKNHFPLDKGTGSLYIRLILKQVASSARQNVLLFIVSFLLTILLAFSGTLLFNAVIKPDNFTSTLSEETPEITLQVKPERMKNIKKDLAEEELIDKILEYSIQTVNVKNCSMKAFVCEDFSEVSNDLCYEGRNPEADSEIAIGSAFANEYDIGDKIVVEYGDKSYSYDIVGFIQSVNFQGEVCELTREGYLHIDSEYSSRSLYLYLEDSSDTGRFLKEIDDKYKDDIVKSINSYKMTMASQEMYSGIVVAVVTSIFILTVLIVLLILYIIIKSLIVRRKQEFGIYKAMGYSNTQLIMQIAGSFLPVSFIAIVSSALLGFLYLPAMNQYIFRMVGAMKNNFEVSLTFLLLVILVEILVNFFISICLALPIKKISAYSLIKE